MVYLTKDELIQLLEKAREDSVRNWLMILLAFSHGLRASEVCGLTTENVQNNYLVIQRLKHSNKTIQPLLSNSNNLLDERTALNEWIKTVKKGERLFPISRVMFWKIFQKYGMLIGLPEHKRHPHVLKHTCGKLGLAGGMQVDTLKQYLGHKSGASTLEYLKSDDEVASQAFSAAIGGTSK